MGFRVAGSAHQKEALLEDLERASGKLKRATMMDTNHGSESFDALDVCLFRHELRVKMALYTHSFSTCKSRRWLAGKIIKAELTRLQKLSSTWKQSLSAR